MTTPITPINLEMNLKTLLQVGGHYGSRKGSWNPRMADYIFGSRNGVYVIDLESTLKLWESAREAIVSCAAAGGTVLFVGTRKNTKEIIRDEAIRANSPYIENRSLGGTLSNFATLQRSIQKLAQLEKLVARAEKQDGVVLQKKEILHLQEQINKLLRKFGGITKMNKLPDMVFFVDIDKDDLLVKETFRAHIPIVAMCDTDNDPKMITYPIPVNNDSTNCLRLMTKVVADAVIEGQEIYKQKQLEAQALDAKASLDLKANSD